MVLYKSLSPVVKNVTVEHSSESCSILIWFLVINPAPVCPVDLIKDLFTVRVTYFRNGCAFINRKILDNHFVTFSFSRDVIRFKYMLLRHECMYYKCSISSVLSPFLKRWNGWTDRQDILRHC